MYISSGLPRAGLGIALAMILFTPTFVGAQSSGGVRNADTKTSKKNAATAARTKAGTLPRTPDGQPDLQGYWTSLSFTPMERPAKYGGREFLTDEEQAQIYKEGVQHSYEFTFDDLAETPVYDSTVYALSAWQHVVTRSGSARWQNSSPDARGGQGQGGCAESRPQPGLRESERTSESRCRRRLKFGRALPLLWQPANSSRRVRQ